MIHPILSVEQPLRSKYNVQHQLVGHLKTVFSAMRAFRYVWISDGAECLDAAAPRGTTCPAAPTSTDVVLDGQYRMKEYLLVFFPKRRVKLNFKYIYICIYVCVYRIVELVVEIAHDDRVLFLKEFVKLFFSRIFVSFFFLRFCKGKFPLGLVADSLSP